MHSLVPRITIETGHKSTLRLCFKIFILTIKPDPYGFLLIKIKIWKDEHTVLNMITAVIPAPIAYVKVVAVKGKDNGYLKIRNNFGGITLTKRSDGNSKNVGDMLAACVKCNTQNTKLSVQFFLYPLLCNHFFS